jgi:hypothetical protein
MRVQLTTNLCPNLFQVVPRRLHCNVGSRSLAVHLIILIIFFGTCRAGEQLADLAVSRESRALINQAKCHRLS